MHSTVDIVGRGLIARFMTDVREVPMCMDAEDPWALTELAKTGAWGGGGVVGVPHI